MRAVLPNDSGQMVNPNGIANQIEGGFIQSLSWALKEQVRFDDTRVLSEDWASYPIITFAEVPPVEVVLIDRPADGDSSAPASAQRPAAAALANAVFDATGNRLPDFPRLLCEGSRCPAPHMPDSGGGGIENGLAAQGRAVG